MTAVSATANLEMVVHSSAAFLHGCLAPQKGIRVACPSLCMTLYKESSVLAGAGEADAESGTAFLDSQGRLAGDGASTLYSQQSGPKKPLLLNKADSLKQVLGEHDRAAVEHAETRSSPACLGE